MKEKTTHHWLELTSKMHCQNYRIFVPMMVWNLPKSSGYQYCYLIIEYLLNTYGKEKFINWWKWDYIKIYEEMHPPPKEEKKEEENKDGKPAEVKK